ncbi:MAG: hypothetical protein ACK59M_14895, partial [Pseudomonadota bacterium]
KLRAEDVRAGKRRVLRLMGVHGLLAPQRGGSMRGPQAHDGTIITEALSSDTHLRALRRHPDSRTPGARV